MEEWQDIWSSCTGNKLYSIYPIVGSVRHNKFLCRHDTVIINRLRIGHTRLTHSYLLSGDDQPTCNTDSEPKGHPPTPREHGEILGRLELGWE